MDFELHRVQAWGAEVPDKPGGAAGVLEPLTKTDANLEFIWSRRVDNKPGFGLMFVAPLTGADQTKAAQAAGFHRAEDLVLFRIQGADRPGLGHFLAAALAREGINIRGMSMAAMAGRFVAYVACDSAEDTNKAIQAITSLNV